MKKIVIFATLMFGTATGTLAQDRRDDMHRRMDTPERVYGDDKKGAAERNNDKKNYGRQEDRRDSDDRTTYAKPSDNNKRNGYNNGNYGRENHRPDNDRRYGYNNGGYNHGNRPYSGGTVYRNYPSIGWGFGMYDRDVNNFDWKREAMGRINYGVRRGLITNSEYRRLMRRIQRVESQEFMYGDNGRISRREWRLLDDDIRDLQREISRQINDDDYYAWNDRTYGRGNW